jgi:type VII secretion-associated protein (TIGR03931 family)
VSDAVVVIGPTAVSGPGAVDPELGAVALDSLDDDLALVDDQVVSVDDLWRDVLGSATAGPCATLMLICPSWWANSRVERVAAAADTWSPNVAVLRRSEVLTTATTVLELARELVVVHADGRRHAIPRVTASSDVVEAIAACVDGLAAVTIDVPVGVGSFGAEVVRALRQRRIDVTVVDDQTLVDAVRESGDETRSQATTSGRRLSPKAAVLAVATLSVSALAAAAVGLDDGRNEPVDTTWLVEGRVAVEVPARWTVERITSGPGSARVQVVSPTNPSEAIHVTQSRVPDAQTLDAAAEALRAALADQPEGVFVDFAGLDERAHRPAVTYSEIRADRRIDWTVLLDGGLRIAIGCQGSVQHAGPEAVCDQAIRSARAIARK